MPIRHFETRGPIQYFERIFKCVIHLQICVLNRRNVLTGFNKYSYRKNIIYVVSALKKTVNYMYVTLNGFSVLPGWPASRF